LEFKDKDIERFWASPVANVPRRVPPELRRVLYRKLQMLDAAVGVSDLKVPPGNRLEQLKGDRDGRYSIRVNDQWRLCFMYSGSEAKGIEFCDYH
jgi:proteic killer suppression protein